MTGLGGTVLCNLKRKTLNRRIHKEAFLSSVALEDLYDWSRILDRLLCLREQKTVVPWILLLCQNIAEGYRSIELYSRRDDTNANEYLCF